MKLLLHSHCSFCGAAYAPEQPWPRVCAACFNVTYRNPTPVAVAVVPVDSGLLLVRRAIPPVGALALPGGFVDWGETWQMALVREVKEETGIAIEAAAIREHNVLSSPAGHLLVFGLVPPLRGAELPAFVATNETSERVVVSSTPDSVAFPLHAQVIRAFFASGGRSIATP